jgi:hypothetical protein
MNFKSSSLAISTRISEVFTYYIERYAWVKVPSVGEHVSDVDDGSGHQYLFKGLAHFIRLNKWS